MSLAGQHQLPDHIQVDLMCHIRVAQMFGHACHWEMTQSLLHTSNSSFTCKSLPNKLFKHVLQAL